MVTLGQKLYRTCILLLYHFLTANTPPALKSHPDERFDIKTQVAKYGYKLTEHQVETPDGYLLTLFRLHGKTSDNGGNVTRPPVLLLHGFLSSSHDFIAIGPDRSIGYMLADSGYDVWLGNCRGNTWSRKHRHLHPEEPRFWQFSFHEIGYYDIPTKLDYIIKKTGFDSIYYIGHSQGTTSMFVTASERPEYIKKVRLFIALSPVVFAREMPALFAQLVAAFYKPLEWFVYSFGYQELLPHWDIQSQAFNMLCSKGTPYMAVCHALLYTNMGYSDDFDSDLIPSILRTFPAGASARQGLHFIQNKISDLFRKYDHGPYQNMKIYGQSHPPHYNLTTNIPTAIIYTDNDWLSTVNDVERISAKLKNLKFLYKPDRRFSHGDYVFGRDMPKTLMPILTKLLREH